MRPLLLTTTLLVACASSSPEPKTTPPAPATSASLDKSAKEPPKPVGSTSAAPPLDFSGAVKAPIFSDDDCSADLDCAPLATCHPNRCVAANKSGTLAPGTLCTMDCRGGTLDCNYNHCGCAKAADGKQKCAVLPGPRP